MEFRAYPLSSNLGLRRDSIELLSFAPFLNFGMIFACVKSCDNIIPNEGVHLSENHRPIHPHRRRTAQ